MEVHHLRTLRELERPWIGHRSGPGTASFSVRSVPAACLIAAWNANPPHRAARPGAGAHSRGRAVGRCWRRRTGIPRSRGEFRHRISSGASRTRFSHCLSQRRSGLVSGAHCEQPPDPDGPLVRCRDEDVSVSGFVDLVSDHDVVIAHRPLTSDPWPARRVHVTPVLQEPIDLAIHREHPLAKQATVSLAELAEETWVAAHEGFALEPLIVQTLSASAGTPIQYTHRVNEFNMVAGIIAETRHVGLLPRYTGLIPYFRDQVVLRPIEGLVLGRHIDILTRPEDAKNPGEYAHRDRPSHQDSRGDAATRRRAILSRASLEMSGDDVNRNGFTLPSGLLNARTENDRSQDND